MASKAATKRVRLPHRPSDGAPVLTMRQLTKEYKTISENPPPYITAHPSESNILE